jgi:predicted MFS family arabinose efflux permease
MHRTYTQFVYLIPGLWRMLAGPVAGAMVNRFGCRKVVVFGSILSAASYFLSVFSSDITVMVVVYGCMGGQFMSISNVQWQHTCIYTYTKQLSTYCLCYISCQYCTDCACFTDTIRIYCTFDTFSVKFE